MRLPPTLDRFFTQKEIPYVIIDHPPVRTLDEAAAASRVPRSALVRAVILGDAKGKLMVVLAADRLIDFDAVQKMLGRDVEPADGNAIGELFPDCEPGSVPPFSAPYGLDTVLDDSLFDLDEVYCEPGTHDCLLTLPNSAFQLIHKSSLRGSISKSEEQLTSDSPVEFLKPGSFTKAHSAAALRPPKDIQREILALDKLPPMPKLAVELLQLTDKPEATARELATIVEQDPSLAAQLMRYARSAFFGYRGRLDSINDAVTRVLGFETVLNIALGLSAGRALQHPSEGPLGLQSIWRHAVYTAAVAQSLCRDIPPGLGIKPGPAYLAGLLHNFGFMLMGHLFKADFFVLNKAVLANPDVPITLIERRLFDVDHTQIGALLLQSWNLPAQVIAAAANHHDETYNGDHAAYANLILVVNHLLRKYGMGDAASDEPPPALITALGIDMLSASLRIEDVFSDREGLDLLARQMAA